MIKLEKQLPNITLSIVSHMQSALIKNLLDDLSVLPNRNFVVIVTVNITEDESPYLSTPFPLHIIRNDSPKGFGENHNQAFKVSTTSYFCILNPDIRINSLDFEDLLMLFRYEAVGAVAPLILSPDGIVEDSARRFPNVLRFAKRILLRLNTLDYSFNSEPKSVDWVAGMFVVFRRDAFEQVNGFDSYRFYMYLEDADICRRLGMKGWSVQVNPSVKVTHAAQRASRRNMQHMRWHVISAFRFLTGL